MAPIVTFDHAEHLVILLTGGGLGVGLSKVARRVSVALPTLPPTAGWWAHLFYNLVKGLGDIDPNDETAASVKTAAIAAKETK